MGTSTRVTHSIICCRILLNLKGAAREEIALPEVTASLKFETSEQQTNQQETSRSEEYDAQGDEKGHEGEVAVVSRTRSIEEGGRGFDGVVDINSLL